MSLVEELARLEEMRARGTLSEDEFQRAKAKLIDARWSSAFVTPATSTARALGGRYSFGGYVSAPPVASLTASTTTSAGRRRR